MLNKLQKKGVSPLITTVLIIGMVVAGSTIVFFWGSGFTEELIEKGGSISLSELSCVSDIKMDLLRHDSSFITVENKGRGKIDAFTIITGGNAPIEEYVEIEPGDIGQVRHNGQGGDKVTVIPKIRIAKGLFQPCTEQKLTYKLT